MMTLSVTMLVSVTLSCLALGWVACWAYHRWHEFDSISTSIMMAAWAIFAATGIMILITTLWDKTLEVIPGKPDEATKLGVTAVLGALGGIVRWINLARSVDISKMKSEHWVFISILSPLQSAGLALLVAVLLRGGVIAFSANDVGTVNWLAIYGVSALVGLFSPEVMDRLNKVVNRLFGDSLETIVDHSGSDDGQKRKVTKKTAKSKVASDRGNKGD